uniref:Uncharacterized protein n=1 Tax=Arundo donax TaxID=35708 RepID=A0A0A9DIR5_ARUDO
MLPCFFSYQSRTLPCFFSYQSRTNLYFFVFTCYITLLYVQVPHWHSPYLFPWFSYYGQKLVIHLVGHSFF